MNESKRNIELNNGWILCPSKSFPGKFYYFNVLTGETAWSLSQADNKGLKKENTIHKIADKSHQYPEPTTLPDKTAIAHSIAKDIKKPGSFWNIPSTPQLPTFGQATFPKYVANIDPLIPNIVWTSVPFPLYCPETKKPMYDKVTQISEFERDIFSQSSDIPLCKRFKNFEKPSLSFDRRNKIVKPPKFETSTPKNYFLECAPESQNCFLNSWIMEPSLKFETMLPNLKIPDVIKSNEKLIVGLSNKVESTKSSIETPKIVEKDQGLENLDSTDLRFLLLAKRKSVDTTIDTAVERKRPKESEIKDAQFKKKVSFNLNNETSEINDLTTQEDFNPLTSSHTRTNIEAPKSPALKDKIPPSFIKDTANEFPPFVKKAVLPTYNNKTWYIVVDTDVLLLDLDSIDKLVLSDPKCKLVIPHAVAADIEALCLGDCRGQQRVISARQLTRKLATPPPHYIVEPHSSEIDSLVVTTEKILNCCMKAVSKNYYVVLITNDPHLQIRATSLNIPSYKINEIKYGGNIKPPMAPETKETKMNTSNDIIDTRNQLNQNLNLFSNLTIIPDSKTIKTNTLRGDIDEKNQYNENFGLFNHLYVTPEPKNIKMDISKNDTDMKHQYNQINSNLNSVKKQIFFSSDSETDNSVDCDKFINVTKPKCLKNVENYNKFDSDSSTSEISNEVFNLNLKGKNVLKTHNAARNPFLPQNFKENGFLNSNTVFNTNSFGKTIPNEKPFMKPIHNFQKVLSNNNLENTETLFCSIPISNMKQLESKLKLANSERPQIPHTCISIRQEPYGVSSQEKILNPSQARVKKIIGSINDSTTNTDSQIETKDSTGVFKVPQSLPFKNGTRNTTAHVENSNVNDKIRTRINIDSIDENLKRFCIKSKAMKEKLRIRIDEWICRYMQIMEDALTSTLQKNSVCMKSTVAPLTLKDILSCIKMLYDSHLKIRDLTNGLSKLLEKCMICVQGKLKMSVAPEDFMKMFGYGVLLVLTLENILPLSEELKEAALRLSGLQASIESNTNELDPELVKSPSVSRTDVEKDEEIVRPQFLKKKSDIIDYLKKHFKEWAEYERNLDDHNQNINNHTDIKVVRTLGKNLNLLKIDKSKTLSLSNNAMEDSLPNKSQVSAKHVKLIENNQLTKPVINDNVETIAKPGTKIMEFGYNENNQNEFENEDESITDEEKDIPLKKLIENIEQDKNKQSKVTEEFNYSTHGNTFQENSETDGPKIIRNIKIIDKFEEKIKNREPLDLDLLDYSAIYEPSVDANLEFDVISENNENTEEKNKNNYLEDNNYGLNNTTSILEDLYASTSISSESKNNNNTFNPKNTITENPKSNINNNNNSTNNNSNYFNTVSNDNVENSYIEEKTKKNNDFENVSETCTENRESHNDSCIGNDNSEINIENFETHNENSETPNYDSGTHLDISESQVDNFDKTAVMVHNDSTNDSGFENDSTHAHSVLKIFFHELSTTFKVIYKFVTTFVDEIRSKELSEKRMDIFHNQASKSLEDMVAIILHLRCIIERESAEETVLKKLIRNAGVEATTDKRMTRYRQIVIKCLEQAQILESALKIIVSTTIGDFEALSTNAETINASIRYFNIFE